MSPAWKQKCDEHLAKVQDLRSSPELVWGTLSSPAPDALRAFQGETEQYLVNVVRANVEDRGVVYECLVVSKADGFVLRISTSLAEILWHQAAAHFN